MTGISWNSVNPRPTDAIFGVVFPSGFQTLVNNLYLLAGVTLFYGVAVLLLRRLTIIDQRARRVVIGELCLAWLVGIWIPLLTALIAVLFLAKATGYFRETRNHLSVRENKSVAPSRRNSLLSPLLGINASLSASGILLVPLAGVVLIVLGNLGLGISFLVGGFLGDLIVLLVRIHRIPLYLSVPKWSPPRWRAFLALLVVVPVVLGSYFTISFLVKPHGPAPASPTSTTATSLSIMTYNIRLAAAQESNPANNWVNRKEELVQYLGTFDLDLFCVQEAYYTQLEYIREYYPAVTYQYTGFGRDDGVHGGEHTAIFFRPDKFRFLDGDTFWLSDTPLIPSRTWGNSHYRVCTWARFEARETGAQFCVFNTHYDFSDEFQELASKIIMQRVAEYSGGLPAFFMGDFNLRNTSHAFQFLEGYGEKPVYDAYRLYHGGTAPFDYSINHFDANYVPSGSRIDFIFVSAGISVTRCWIPKDSYGDAQTYSDHYPVVAECVF